MFFRYYRDILQERLAPGRVLVLYGPRRVGKTFLVQQFLHEYQGRVFSGVGDDALVREILESESVSRITSSFADYDLVVIDEAQKIANVGQGLKILVDHLPQVQVIATGSSSFDLANKVGEPLTGRKTTLLLFPLSVLELRTQHGALDTQAMLEQLLIFGSYPETLSHQGIGAKAQYLGELRDAYLYKDILELENLRNSRKLLDLLTLLAFQIGQEVSLTEIGASLGLSKQTVERYLDLLEKTFVIRNVRGFSRNLRKEVTKTSRYYFLDNGVRNAVINNFNPLSRRNDIGQLWENFVYVERLKQRTYLNIFANEYFWRTYDRQEIYLVEEREGTLFGYEFKYSAKKQKKAPKAWREAYSGAHFATITQENFLEFLTEEQTSPLKK
jgi:predicted AAA+ superfamily ATPase